MRKKWKKIGGGSFRLHTGKIIKPNQIFMAREEDIPEAFRDLVVPVEEEGKPRKTRTSSRKKAEYSLRKAGEGLFDIVGPDGKVLNEAPLPKAEAEKALSALVEER